MTITNKFFDKSSFFMRKLMLDSYFFRHRHFIPAVQNNNYVTINLIGAEIGVEHGFHANMLLKHLPIKKLFLIDLVIQEDTVKRLSKFQEKTVFIEKSSSSAVKDIPNNLNFVYIDGNHSYDFVKEDLELYYPKVKKGGIIGGHDFNSGHLGLCKAVVEFAEKNNLKLQGKGIDWWMVI